MFDKGAHAACGGISGLASDPGACSWAQTCLDNGNTPDMMNVGSGGYALACDTAIRDIICPHGYGGFSS